MADAQQAVSCHMIDLNFPGYQFFVRGEGRSQEIFDPISQKYVVLTPEEWVRQHLVQYLVQDKGAPIGLLRREIQLRLNGVRLRADVVAYDRSGRPVIVAECKAPHVELNQATFDQVGRYNKKLRARYVIITNGLSHYFCRVNHALRSLHFIDDLPGFESICTHGDRS